MVYLVKNGTIVMPLLLQHLQITTLALLIAVGIALPLALLVYHYPRLNLPVLGTLGMLYTVPSLALMILLIPLFGLNSTTVVTAIVLYSQVILVRNLIAGLESIPATILEAGRGMGMSAWQCWWWVQVPLILPIFIAGIRLATVVGIGIATIGAKFGAGGLGVLLFDGIAQNRADKIWAGAIAVAMLALGLNFGLLGLEKVSRFKT